MRNLAVRLRQLNSLTCRSNRKAYKRELLGNINIIYQAAWNVEKFAEVICNFLCMIAVTLSKGDENTFLVSARGAGFCIDLSVVPA